MPPVAVHPEADLASRPNAEEPTKEELLQLDLFQQLRKKPDITRFPQSMVIRRIAKGDVICRQGQAGASAFYILTTDDVLRLKNHQLEQVRRTLAEFEGETPDAPEIVQLRKLQEEYRDEISRFEQRKTQQPAAQPEQDESETRQQVATAYLLLDSPGRRTAASGGLLGRLRRVFAGSNGDASNKPEYISIDGPSDVDYAKRTAPMFEGDVFGEMSCLTFAPRSATVVADNDCYMLEFLRSIFDQIQKDTSYKQRTEEIYRKRVLATQFRRMEFFSDVEQADLDVVRQHAHLEIVEPGTVICDEGDPSECVYLIRSGLVQVVKNANVSLSAEDVVDWPKLCSALLKGAEKDAKPAAGQADTQTTKAASPAGGGGSGALQALKARLAQKAKQLDQAPATAAPQKSPVEMLKERLAAKAQHVQSGSAGQQPAAGQALSSPTKSTAAPTESTSKSDKPAAPAVDQPKSERLEKLMADISAKSAAKKTEVAPAKLVKESTADSAKAVAAAKKQSAPKPGQAAGGKKPSAKASPLDALKRKTAKPSLSPVQKVWQALSAEAQGAVRQLTRGEDADESARQCLLDDLNRLIRDSSFVTSADLKELRDTHETLAPVRAFGKAEKHWTGLDTRVAGRLMLEAIYPGCIHSRSRSGKTPRIVAYLSRGDIFGEMGVVAKGARTATVIAYDHPPDDSGRRPSRLEVVRIDGAVFDEILDRSPALRRKILEKIKLRKAQLQVVESERPWESDALMESSEFRDMGFAQGQRMLLIDLDRCTRCGDCVRACISTHEDGYTRLFLDGPKFDRFLVPSACRSCRNPACMIGCPVGSIQRGDNGEILIRDWCIGCEICAKQCPYDSIQMHDRGLISSFEIGWQYAAATAVGSDDSWKQRTSDGDGWTTTISPIRCDFDFLNTLEGQNITAGPGPAQVCFRYAFRATAALSSERVPIRFEIESFADDLQVWLNGRPIELYEEVKKGRRTGRYRSPAVHSGITPNEAAKESGVTVMTVQAGSAAAKAGLKTGDVLTEWHRREVPSLKGEAAATDDGSSAQQEKWQIEAIGDWPGFVRLLCDHDPGDQARVKIRRSGSDLLQSIRLPGAGELLNKRDNVVAAVATLPAAQEKAVLDLRLDRVPEVEHLPPGVTEAEAKMVVRRAVVCDLCSSLPSQDPACVAQCPHDAAFRIDALYEPKRLAVGGE